ncbi:MAG: ribosome biogenesis GTPase Der [Planctomycetota bacterium]
MSLATVAIVGRPNVGKSSYLNAVIGRRIAIVEPTPGVTRDRLIIDVRVGDRNIQLMDTGGIGIVDVAQLDDDIAYQIDMAIELADAVIFLVDGKDGITALDQQVADTLRRLKKPVILGVNKIDHPKRDPQAGEFWALGLGEPHPLSALEKLGVDALLDDVVAMLPEDFYPGESPNELPKFAFVGKRNVGKSTLLNTMAGEARVIVSEIAGTTRDAVDVDLEYEGLKFTAIDTAGVMKKGKVPSSIDFYSQTRTEAAIRRCDVVLFLIDATDDISQVDKKIAMQVRDQGKPCILAINKWDLASGRMESKDYLEYIGEKLPGFHFAPVVFISALEEFNTKGVLEVAFDIYGQASKRVGTGELNRLLEQAFEKRKPGGKRGYKARIYYGAQVETSPPTFVVFVNDLRMFPENYRRYLENRLREAFDFAEVPLQVRFRRRTSLYHA